MSISKAFLLYGERLNLKFSFGASILFNKSFLITQIPELPKYAFFSSTFLNSSNRSFLLMSRGGTDTKSESSG